MKFTNGYWLMRPGVEPVYPVQLVDCELSSGAVTAYGAARAVHGRGDTLNAALFTVTARAAADDVIEVDAVHHAGVRERGPEFARPDPGSVEPQDVEVADGASACSIRSGRLSASFEKGERWRLRFDAEGRLLTDSAFRNLAHMTVRRRPPVHIGAEAPDGSGSMHRHASAGERTYMVEQLRLSVGELVYGLGERFTPFVKNGQVVDIWNEDGGTASEQAYKNVPFYYTNRGYGVFVDHPGRVSFEVGSEKVSRVGFSVGGERLRYYVIYGPTPAEIVRKYTALTGRPARPPAWSFGLWLSTSFTTEYDEKTVNGMIDGMQQSGIPLSVFHFDCFWMRPYRWTDFTWDPDVFPDPRGMLQRLKERGLRICVWINPYIAQRSTAFDEAARAGYLLRTPEGDVRQSDLWQAGMGFVDVTNPDARAWYRGRLAELLDMGVDAFKTDFGERIPLDVRYFDGSDPERMHNYYSYLYNEMVFDLLREKRGEGEAIVFARSATAGGQRFPVHWGGDCEATYESMAESLRGGLSLCSSGFAFWSHDIGGFEHTATADLYKRWAAFGLLSTHSRLHGSGSYRVPWNFDDEASDVLRHFTRLKMSLMPYLYRHAVEAATSGTPLMRSMAFEFPNDPSCEHLDRQYMLGPSLLVAPVLDPNGSVRFYVPEGRWTDIQSGERFDGPRWYERTYDYFGLPLLAAPGSVVVRGATDDSPEYDYVAGASVHLHAPHDAPRTVTLVQRDGTEAVVLQVDQTDESLKLSIGVTAEIPDESAPDISSLRVVIHAVAPPEDAGEVRGATFESDGDRVVLRPRESEVTLPMRPR